MRSRDVSDLGVRRSDTWIRESIVQSGSPGMVKCHMM